MISITPIGAVINQLEDIDQINFEDQLSEIILNQPFNEEFLKGIEKFTHIEIIYYYHLLPKFNINEVESNNYGVFAHRNPNRPNRLGTSIVKLLRKKENKLFVLGLDAVNGTPVLDIKPVYKSILPAEEINHPDDI